MCSALQEGRQRSSNSANASEWSEGGTALLEEPQRRQVLVHPALVQPDGFQGFLHAPHLRAALLQPGEKTLNLQDGMKKVTPHLLHRYHTALRITVVAKQRDSYCTTVDTSSICSYAFYSGNYLQFQRWIFTIWENKQTPIKIINSTYMNEMYKMKLAHIPVPGATEWRSVR